MTVVAISSDRESAFGRGAQPHVKAPDVFRQNVCRTGGQMAGLGIEVTERTTRSHMPFRLLCLTVDM